MAEKPYVRDPNSPGGSKFVSAEDEEDFAQEKLIQEWLKREGMSHAVEFKYINRKGNARNTIDKRSLRLDQEISHEGGGRTYADIIAGSDGRDLECGQGPLEIEREPEKEISWNLFALGFNEGEVKWLIRMWKSLIQENKSLFGKLATDSEW